MQRLRLNLATAACFMVAVSAGLSVGCHPKGEEEPLPLDPTGSGGGIVIPGPVPPGIVLGADRTVLAADNPEVAAQIFAVIVGLQNPTVTYSLDETGNNLVTLVQSGVGATVRPRDNAADQIIESATVLITATATSGTTSVSDTISIRLIRSFGELSAILEVDPPVRDTTATGPINLTARISGGSGRFAFTYTLVDAPPDTPTQTGSDRFDVDGDGPLPPVPATQQLRNIEQSSIQFIPRGNLAGVYTFRLEVRDQVTGLVRAAVAQLTIQPVAVFVTLTPERLRQPPGAPNTVTAQVSGDFPPGQNFTYSFDILSGPPGATLNPTMVSGGMSVDTIFTPPANVTGSWALRVEVTEPAGQRAFATTIITVEPFTVAIRSPNLSVLPGGPVQLTADIEGGSPNFTATWTSLNAQPIFSGQVSVVQTNLTDDSQLNFAAPLVAGTYPIRLTVQDSLGFERTAEAELFVVAPTLNVDVTTDRLSVALGGSLMLTAVPIGGSPAYTVLFAAPAGTFAAPNPVVEPFSGTPITKQYTAPNVAGLYTLSVTVTDTSGAIVVDSVQITVEPANVPPVANAGADINAVVAQQVVLNALGSTDPDSGPGALTYSWAAPAGITLTNATSPTPSFVVPASAAGSTLTFSVAVSDGAAMSIDTVNVIVGNAAPIAAISPLPPFIVPSASLMLSGAGSSDPDNGPAALTYQWSFTSMGGSGNFAGLAESTSLSPTFSFVPAPAPRGAEYTFTLTVSDSLASDSDMATVRINRLPVAIAQISATNAPAGTDIFLGAISSSDPDLQPLSYTWEQLSGPPVFITDVFSPVALIDLPNTPGQTLTFRVIVSDGLEIAISNSVSVTVGTNAAPIVDAGADQIVPNTPGLNVALSGSASDPDNSPNSPMVIEWAQIAGPAAVITNPGNVSASFTLPAGIMAGTALTFRLRADDGLAAGEDVVTFRVNTPPTASAGPDQIVSRTPGTVVSLSGTGSASGDVGQALTSFTWVFNAASTGPAVAPAANAASSFAVPAGFDAGETIILDLTVSDGLDTATDQVVITANTPPLAVAGGPLTAVNVFDTVTLLGSGSGDADGQPLTYVWTQLMGPSVSLSTPTQPNTTFVVPPAASGMVLQFQLVVNDGIENSAPAAVGVAVGSNEPPVALAPPPAIIAIRGTNVALDGSASFDPDSGPLALSYFWSHLTGPQNLIASPTAQGTTFGIPPMAPFGTEYQVRLRVSDGLATDDYFKLIRANIPPTANAGPDRLISLTAGTPFVLDGSGSVAGDPGQSLTQYQWAVVSGPTPGNLPAPPSANPTLIATIPVGLVAGQTIELSLIVSDGLENSPADSVVLTANTPPVAVATIASPRGLYNAGDPTTYPLPGDVVLLNGSFSSDVNAQPLNFTWTIDSTPAALLINPTSIEANFVMPAGVNNVAGTLIVSDGLNNTSLPFTILVGNNQSPIANAGADQIVASTAPSVLLSGVGSSDPNAGPQPLSFEWALLAGPVGGSFTPANAFTTATPTYSFAATPGAGEVYLFRLIVSDAAATDDDTVTIRRNTLPTANGGPDRLVPTSAGVAFILDASASTSNDPAQSIAQYTWTKVSGPASFLAAPLVTASPASAFVVPAGGFTPGSTIELALVVNDGLENSPADPIVLTANTPPTAVATIASVRGLYDVGNPSTWPLPGDTVLLSGLNSTDINGQQLSFTWTAVSVVLINPTTIDASFTVPLGVSAVTGTLNVSDGLANTPVDFTINIGSIANQTPIANAGADQVLASTAPTVVLDGSGSSDPNAGPAPLSFEWALIGGPTGGGFTPANAFSTVSPTYTFGMTPGAGQVFVFRCIVSDSVSNDADTVTITRNTPPTANAGADRVVTTNPVIDVQLDGSSSTSNNPGQVITQYTWSQVGGNDVLAAPVVSASPTLLINMPGGFAAGDTRTLQLVVNDGLEGSVADQIVLTGNTPPTANIVVASTRGVYDAGNMATWPQVGDTVVLQGVGVDLNAGQPLAYTWIATSPSVFVPLTNPLEQQAEFVVPSGAGTVTVDLVVSDTITTGNASVMINTLP